MTDWQQVSERVSERVSVCTGGVKSLEVQPVEEKEKTAVCWHQVTVGRCCSDAIKPPTTSVSVPAEA